MKSIINILVFSLLLIYNGASAQVNDLSNNPDSGFSISDAIAGISAILALIAIVISIVTAQKTHNLANKDFLLTHRPFIWVENFGYINSQNVVVSPINQVIIVAQNSPAKIHKESFEYYIIDQLGVKTLIQKREVSGQILYPSDKTQYTNTSELVTDQIIQALTPNQEMERIIRIDYSWLSSEKKYFFEGKWRFDKRSHAWKNLIQTAN